MKCPQCKGEVTPDNHRVKYEPFYGTKKVAKIARGNVFYCPNCKQYFRPALRLIPCEIFEQKDP